jgi:hypothetical protein
MRTNKNVSEKEAKKGTENPSRHKILSVQMRTAWAGTEAGGEVCETTTGPERVRWEEDRDVKP